MIDFSRTMNLSFWFSWSFSIVTIFSSAISAKETNAFLSLFIFEKRVIILSFFINFFIVNNRFFNIFIVFLKSSKTIESWVTFVAIFATFFSRAEKFEYIFSLKCANFLLIRINSKDRNAIKDDDSSLWKKKRKDDERRKNLSFVAKINERKVEALQSIKHHRIREFSQNNRAFRNKRKHFENQKIRFDYFFHRFNHRFNRFFFWLNNLLHRNKSDIKIRTTRYSSIENRTESTSFVLESRKIEHTFNSFFQTVQTESLIILIFQIICVFDRLQMNRVVSARLQIFRSDLDEIRSLSKVHKFSFFTLWWDRPYHPG